MMSLLNMAKDYGTTKSEVTKEMADVITDYFKHDFPRQVRETAESIYYFGDGFAKGLFHITISFPYAFSTASRLECENELMNIDKFEIIDESNDYKNGAYGVGVILGGVAGFITDIFQALLYAYLVSNNRPEVLAIPAVSNTVSLVYEKARKNLIEKRQH